ncbi:MAG: PDZ domain-containing protein [Minicystis sp.]
MRTAAIATLALSSSLLLEAAGPARAEAPANGRGNEDQPPAEPRLDQPPAEPRDEAAPPRSAEAHKDRVLGLALADVKGGARITGLDLQSPSAALLEPEDVIVAADGRPVRSAADLREYLASLSKGAPVLLQVRRRGQIRYLGVQLTQAPPPPVPNASTRGTPRSRAPETAGPSTPGAATGEAPAGARPGVVVQIVPSAPSVMVGPVGGGGGADTDLGMRPPAFSAPGMAQVPGAIMPPAPATPSYAYPQTPGVSQPPGFIRPPLPYYVSPQPFAPGGATGTLGTTPANPLPPGAILPGAGTPAPAVPVPGAGVSGRASGAPGGVVGRGGGGGMLR